MPPKGKSQGPKELGQPLIIAVIVIVVIAVGVFGWLQLRTSTPNVTPEQTKAGVDRQMQGMMDAMRGAGKKPK